jgi:hypothetical protein
LSVSGPRMDSTGAGSGGAACNGSASIHCCK